MTKINKHDWTSMTPGEKEGYAFSILGVEPEQLDGIIREYTAETGKKPNAIFISWITLSKMPVKVKHFHRLGIKLTVIPMDAQEGQFVLSLQDPHNWGNLFYS